MNRKQVFRVAAIAGAAGVAALVSATDQPVSGVRQGAVAVAPALTAAPEASALASVAAPAPPAAPEPTPQVLVPPGVLQAASELPDSPLPDMAATVPEAPVDQPAAASECREDMALIAQPGAMVDLGLLAPCRPDQRVVIRHAGLAVTGQTSSAGTLVASIPAFEAPASVELTFADGTSMVQTVEVPGLEALDRFAVQWMAGDSFALHALPPGATFGGPGHVSAVDPGEPGTGRAFLSLLGDAKAERGLFAQVVTWPAGAVTAGGMLLSIEAAVTPETCGREMLAETLQRVDGKMTLRDLSLAMPGCEAIGEFVALADPVLPERLAAR